MPRLSKPSFLLILALVAVALLFVADSDRLGGEPPVGSSVIAGLPFPKSGLTVSEAVVLGAVEGATEYLPVSSTGHLLLVQRLLGIGDAAGERDAADAYAIIIQAGAILAVLVAFPHRIAQLYGGLTGRDAAGRRLLGNLLLAFVPAACFGLLLGEGIKGYLFHPVPIALAWFVGGIGILLLTRYGCGDHVAPGRDLLELTPRQALVVGLAQSIALWPGVSRSLVTIAAALLLGLSLPAAIEFSFLLGLVTLTAATAWELLEGGRELFSVYGWMGVGAGLLSAFVSALLVIRWMIAGLGWQQLHKFGYYRIALACAAGVLIALGVI